MRCRLETASPPAASEGGAGIRREPASSPAGTLQHVQNGGAKRAFDDADLRRSSALPAAAQGQIPRTNRGQSIKKARPGLGDRVPDLHFLVAGQDLNLRPLGCEDRGIPLNFVRQPKPVGGYPVRDAVHLADRNERPAADKRRARQQPPRRESTWPRTAGPPRHRAATATPQVPTTSHGGKSLNSQTGPRSPSSGGLDGLTYRTQPVPRRCRTPLYRSMCRSFWVQRTRVRRDRVRHVPQYRTVLGGFPCDRAEPALPPPG